MIVTTRQVAAAASIAVAMVALPTTADAKKRRFKNGEIVCKNFGTKTGQQSFTDLVDPAKPFGALSTDYRYHLKVQGPVLYPFKDSNDELYVPTGMALEGAATAHSTRRPKRKRGKLISRTEIRLATGSDIDFSFSASLPAGIGVSGSKTDGRVATLSAQGSTTTSTSVQSLVAAGDNAFNPPILKDLQSVAVRSRVAAGPGTNFYDSPFSTWKVSKKSFKPVDGRVPGLTRDCAGTSFD